jgi:hypothetical protein
MLDRWQQVYRAGEVTLHPFTAAEVDAVTLGAEALPAGERGPFLQAVTPLLTGQGAPGDGAAEGWGPAIGRGGGVGASRGRGGGVRASRGRGGPEMEGSAAAARAEAVASLERHGFLRAGPPAPATGPAPDELAGWAVGPDGDLAARRQVALIGDLAVITRIRAQPIWVAEATVSPDPTQPDATATGWRLLARMYAPYRPPVGLIEMPGGTDRRMPPFVLVRDDRAVQILVGWCGADLAAFAEQRAQGGAAEPSPFAGPPVPVPTAEQASAFATVVQLRVALAEGERVVLRNLVVASGRTGHWLLEGEWWQRAVPASVDELGQRVAAMLRVPD